MATKHRKPGRPEIGGRVTIALGPLLARIDAARGRTTRAAWLRSAAEHALACPTVKPDTEEVPAVSTEAKVGERGIPLPATSHLGDWTIDTGDDGETTVTGPAPLRFTKRGGRRIYHYEVIQWLRRNGDIARSGGTVDLTTGTFRTDTEETP